MNYDDYVDHILRKYKLTVACGIIKSKPKGLTIMEYTKKLQEKLTKDKNFDKISIQSDDFEFDETQNMNLHDFENDIPSNTITVDLNENGNSKMEDGSFEKLPTNQKLVESVKNRIELTYVPKNSKFIPESQIIEDDLTQIDKETAIQEPNIVSNMNYVENMDSVSTYCDKTKTGDTNKAIDSQATELYSLDDSYISQSQDIGFSILEQFVLGVRKRKPKEKVTKTELSKKVCNNISTMNVENDRKTDEKGKTKNIAKTETDSNKKVCNNISVTNVESAQKTDEKAKTTENMTKTDRSRKVCNNISAKNVENCDIIEKKAELCKKVCNNISEKNTSKSLKTDQNTVTSANNNENSANINELKEPQTKNHQNSNKKDKQNTKDSVNKEIDFTTTQEIDIELHEEIQNIITTQEVYNTEDLNFTSEEEKTDRQTQSQEMDDIFGSQNEVVPFKIIEELNRVKLYMKRGRRMSVDGNSSDTGYHSGSQWSAKSSIQGSEKWLNQSAHTLVNYITNSAITITTLDICNDISHVLGDLVDKLHSDENYPQFMETILENVNSYLDQIYEDDDEDMELKKDEIIHRLVYLSQSVHIISYILEKITLKLEIIHIELTSLENVYEISKIDETKNISYIFHVLEILLQRYIRKKDSIYSKKSYIQEKKISISDIWRKKWIPEQKSKELQVIDEEKQCILTKTSEILNKIIVDCMEMYSLISFAALQCFNIIQK